MLFYLTVEYNKTSDGWIQYNGSQYFINDDLLPMEDARSFCKKNHADLVVISGQTERKFLWKQVFFLKISRLLIIFLFDIDGCLDQCFFKPVQETPIPAYFVCLPNLTHLIISSLIETARPELGVSDKSVIQCVQSLGLKNL